MEYTDEEREEAIEACAMMASSNMFNAYGTTPMPHPITYFGDAIDTSSRAADLARAALWAGPYGEERVSWARAECMLREGWTPSEKNS